MTDKPQQINGWELQDQTDDLVTKKILAHWELNKHLYENASQNLKGLWMLRLAIHWWEDPAMREHRNDMVEAKQWTGTGDILTFYSKAVGIEI